MTQPSDIGYEIGIYIGTCKNMTRPIKQVQRKELVTKGFSAHESIGHILIN